MVIKPPRQVRMSRVFEIDDDVRVAVKQAVFEELIGAMCQTRVQKFGIRVKPAL